ncbi:hypothetical protein Xvie_03011 [Xenorhabdus vietnamensis]|uniref:Uncharacterized protein n=1 Tax=Xenorhabdus vietnamensis TaxID=351656 RepID=A0A1Y2S9A5_9GAMM|nr:hypothetical protein Xvie_03011 [Xenorhabdus vietnamensis]
MKQEIYSVKSEYGHYTENNKILLLPDLINFSYLRYSGHDVNLLNLV